MKVKRLSLFTILAMLVVLVATTVAAGPPVDPPGQSGDHAVVFLGERQDVDGRIVQGYAFIDFKPVKGHKPNHNPGGKPGNGGGEKCFAFLANGAAWKTTEDYVVDPTNIHGLNESRVRTLTAQALDAWDSEVATDIFGSEDTGAVVTRDPNSIYGGADTTSPDGLNEVMFGDLDSNVVGVTVVWGIFTGRPSARGLVEWDTVFNQVDFDWGLDIAEGDPVIDFEGLAAHEFGHSTGMGHPDDSCTEETMYRFVRIGEIKNRDLHTGDIAGINDLY